jgi:HlyD family secretion protein
MSAPDTHLPPWHRGIRASAKWPVLAGLAIVFVCGGGFALWATLAPLSGAVVASGHFVATGQNKLVQHLEGGLLRQIHVREGELVEAGAVVARMDDTGARTKLRRLVLKRQRLLAMEARLHAELDDRDDFPVPAALVAERGDPEVKAIIARQRTELAARRDNLSSQKMVLEKEIAGIQESIRGYEAQADAGRRRSEIFNEELRDRNVLLKQGLTRKSEVLALRRAEAGVGGELGELSGRIADAQERIARARQRIVQVQSEAVKSTVEELRGVEGELDDVQEQILAAKDVAERVEVRAPARGVIVKLNYHTSGAVVAPGAVILEMLPVQDELIIEAQIKPNDVTHVVVGQGALIRLSALNQRITPTVLGNVTYLSADALTDPTPSPQPTDARARHEPTRRDFYVVRVRLDEADVSRRLVGFLPTPGMPAEVYIKTGERTFFQYILRPVFDSFSHAFRES